MIKRSRQSINLLPHLFLIVSIAGMYALPVSAKQSLQTMTVTANRAPLSPSLAATTVITRADIERLQISDLPTLLSKQAGIDLVQYGGPGKLSSIFMRGTNSNHVLMLVDGVKWHAAGAGNPSSQYFPLAQIDRIEIVRGSRSALYGSEAIGGVIHIFTRKGRQGLRPHADIAYGTHNTKKVTLGVGGGDALTNYHVSINHHKTTGINVRDKSNPDRDGYRNNNVSATIQHQLDNLTLSGRFLRAAGVNDYDGSSKHSHYSDEVVEQIISTQADIAINDMWSTTLLMGESRDEQQYLKDRDITGTSNTRHRFASMINHIAITPHQTLNIGLDYTVDDLSSRTKYRKKSRDNKAAFISWQANMDKHSWLLSARHDKNQAFGTHNTHIAEWGYWLTDALQFTANAATAFKAPSFNELYWPKAGNPNLKPEESKQYQLGLRGGNNPINWELALYRNKVKNLISGWPPKNISRAKVKGIEFTVTGKIHDWDIALNTSLLRPEDDKTGKILPRRTHRLANLNVDKTIDKWLIGSSWRLRDHSFNKANEKDKLGGYGLVDLRISYQLDRDWRVKMSVDNALNKRYAAARDWSGDDYKTLGRTAMVALSYQPI